MKVHELIKQLKELPQHLEVIMSGDDEGNSHRKVSGADVVRFLEEEYDISVVSLEDINDGWYDRETLKDVQDGAIIF